MFRKKKSLVRKTSPSVASSELAEAQDVYEKSSNLIREGLDRPCASTGTPISKLHGAAKTIAQMSNIGGGSKSTGGQGIQGGLSTIVVNTDARARIQTHGLSTTDSLPSKHNRKLISHK